MGQDQEKRNNSYKSYNKPLEQGSSDTDLSGSSFTTSPFQHFFDQYGRYIQHGAIGMGIIGLVVISRSIRMGTKFSNADMIPKEFYQKHVKLYGQIKCIGKEDSVLMVEHLPIWRSGKWIGKTTLNDGLLRLQIPGLEFKQSFEFMENVNPKVSHGRIRFTLLQFNEANNSALCLVYHRRLLFFSNLGVWCVKNNVASMSSSRLLQELPTHMWNIKMLPIYYKPLFKLEKHSRSEPLYRKIFDKFKYFINKLISRKKD